MTELTPLRGKIGVFVGPHAEHEMMMQLSAVLALSGPVSVLAGGNRFDAYKVARAIRRQTHQLEPALGRVQIARAFTCYQMVALLEQTPAGAAPQLVTDLLTTFDDDNVSISECHRLLQIVIMQLRRLARPTAVVVSLRPPQLPGRLGMVTQLTAIADYTFTRHAAAPEAVQPGLF